ncbi:flagellar assembly factor FliW [Sporomusaceae bacterium FL31]|nr:flagellar assembly factor FliW [Sporomusaceae bacterium FL31]GCE33854.1 flagellar assembly factor FliW [Sporomusaceae bacterium]
MIIQSTRLGSLEVKPEDIIQFPNGLPGFIDEKEFILIPCETKAFAFLQSLTEANLTFLVVDPFSFFSDYEFTLDDQVLAVLDLSEQSPPQILNIVTVPEKAEDMTANLLAPIIYNPVKRLAQQIILEKVPYTIRQRLFPQGLPSQGGK